MLTDIEKYRNDTWFNFLHWEFGELLARRGNVPEKFYNAAVLLGAKCVQAVEQGHSCLDLGKWYAAEKLPDTPLPSPLTVAEWQSVIDNLPDIVGKCTPDGDIPFCPLLFYPEKALVYLHKYYNAEIEIASFIRRRLAPRKLAIPVKVLAEQVHNINTLFAKKTDYTADPQQRAAVMALTHDFSILTGGPGTGKTTVLATILAMELNIDPLLRIGLAAPTGKAAMQMLDSINAELVSHLDHSKLKNGVKEKLTSLKCSTIHRMLGICPDDFAAHYNESNLLPFDLVVIDESSMVSVRLMQQLCRALPANCRLLMIGDQNQLAAVDAGSLLGDLCLSCTLLQSPPDAPPEKSYITALIENHRADANLPLKKFIGTINTVSALNSGISAELTDQIELLYSGTAAQFRAAELQLSGNQREKANALEKMLAQEIDQMLANTPLPSMFYDTFGTEKAAAVKLSLAHWRTLSSSASGADDLFDLALAHFYTECFRIICAVHDGIFGEYQLNRMMATIMGKNIGSDGVPIIILKNDHHIMLNNGDIGICWNGKVCFPKWLRNENGSLRFDRGRELPLTQLPTHTLAYAITIHKSQGSGFDNVIMVLPDKENNVLCRELVYTGISRTKRNFLLWSSKELFCRAADRRSCRWSGMANWLKG